eukprot:5017970-Amphidinium_carterae.1
MALSRSLSLMMRGHQHWRNQVALASHPAATSQRNVSLPAIFQLYWLFPHALAGWQHAVTEFPTWVPNWSP